MEHLVIHLTREAILSRPVQYRWMYLYESLTFICPLSRLFDDFVRHTQPQLDEKGLENYREKYFAEWLEQHVCKSFDDLLSYLKGLARGPLRHAWSYKGYFINGFKFYTDKYGEGRVTHNSRIKEPICFVIQGELELVNNNGDETQIELNDEAEHSNEAEFLDNSDESDDDSDDIFDDSSNNE
nr:hypothetical protein [Tanacetum cinerariifolium]